MRVEGLGFGAHPGSNLPTCWTDVRKVGAICPFEVPHLLSGLGSRAPSTVLLIKVSLTKAY